MRRLPLLLVVAAAVTAIHARTDEPATPAALRRAVERALPPLQSSADTWFAKRECASCHHQTLGLIAMTVARERGFAVDEGVVRGQLARTLRPRRHWQEAYVTGDVSINEAIGQSYRAVGVGTAGGTRTAITDAMSYLLAGRQHESGRWPSYSRRPPLEDSEFTATAFTIRTLALFPLRGRETEFAGRIARGRAWLSAATPADTEDRAMQLLGLAWAGAAPDDMKRQADALLATQSADGGWAQIPTREADAYATGLAVVALNQAARVPMSDARIGRALAHLLASQLADGTWHVRTRRTFRDGLPYFETGFPHGPDQFISYAASGWAATALALALDDGRSPALMGTPPARFPASPPGDEPDGLTPLMRAALYGTLADLDALLAGGAEVNAASPSGLTALMCAVHDDAKVARLLAAGADPSAATKSGHTALQLAAGYSGARASVDRLLARGVAVDRPVADGNFPGATALARAIMRGDAALAAELRTRGATVNAPAPGRFSPLVAAVWHGDVGMVRWLLRNGAAVDAPFSDDFGRDSTALMLAVEDGRPDVVRALLEHGANPNAVDADGVSPLLFAALAIDRGSAEIAERLVAAGADRTLTGPMSLTPAALARRWGKPHVAAAIERAP